MKIISTLRFSCVFLLFSFLPVLWQSGCVLAQAKKKVPVKATKKAPVKAKKANTPAFKPSNSSTDDSKSLVIEEKIERKISLSPYVGVALFTPDVEANEFGIPTSVFTGYAPAPHWGVMAFYKYKKRVYFGADGSFFITSREGGMTRMNLINTGIYAKLNLINAKKRISPYFLAGGNFAFVNIGQSSRDVDFDPDTNSAGQGFVVRQANVGFNEVKVRMAPLVGPMIGAGIDFKINRKFTAFVQGALHSTISVDQLVDQAFPENNSNLVYIAAKGGVNIKLYKRMRFEIDSEYVRVPDAIALLAPIESDEVPKQMLSREGNFAVNIREGLKHNVQIIAANGEINIQMEQADQDSPCEILAVCYDEFGNKVAVIKPGPDKQVHFGNLPKGKYNVSFEVQPPCKEGNFSYSLNEPGNEIAQQFNSEIPTDSLNYNIEGFVEFKDPSVKKENVQVMLVDQNNKQIKAKQTTRTDGGFAFKNLAPGNYKVVYEVASPKVQSRIAYDIKIASKDSVIKKVSFPFNEVRRTSEGSRLMAGKLSLNDPTVQTYKLRVDLVDKYNRVLDQSIPNEEGGFEFIDNQQDKNELVYDLLEKKQTKPDEAPLTVSISYEPKVEEAKKMAEIAARTLAPVAPKIEAPTLVSNEQMEMYKLYDKQGREMRLVGFGFQVGAFRNMANVIQLMDKLKQDGFDVYVQAIWSAEAKTRFKTSQNYKINRVIVYGSIEEGKSNTIRQKLLESGYEIIVKEHFSDDKSSDASQPKN